MVYVTSEYRHTITPISVIDDLYGLVLPCLPEVSAVTLVWGHASFSVLLQ